MRHIESHIQKVCLRWARLQFPVCQKLMFSVPNGAHLSMVQARILKAEGMTAGVADMLLLQTRATVSQHHSQATSSLRHNL